jgi:hypothetical protein
MAASASRFAVNLQDGIEPTIRLKTADFDQNSRYSGLRFN